MYLGSGELLFASKTLIIKLSHHLAGCSTRAEVQIFFWGLPLSAQLACHRTLFSTLQWSRLKSFDHMLYRLPFQMST